MAYSLGPNAKLYRNAGSYGSPSWTVIGLVSDLSSKGNWDMGEGSTRLSRAKLYAKTMLDIEITGKIREDLTDAGYAALAAQLNSDTPIDLLVLDGPSTTNGQRGYRADWHVSTNDQDQGLGTVIFDSFTLKPGISDNLPMRALVSGGGPVFTAIAAGGS